MNTYTIKLKVSSDDSLAELESWINDLLRIGQLNPVEVYVTKSRS
jgi:hypothetical protein